MAWPECRRPDRPRHEALVPAPLCPCLLRQPLGLAVWGGTQGVGLGGMEGVGVGGMQAVGVGGMQGVGLGGMERVGVGGTQGVGVGGTQGPLADAWASA